MMPAAIKPVSSNTTHVLTWAVVLLLLLLLLL
jgi:hypothetical protein